jgi:hypothetical protein
MQRISHRLSSSSTSCSPSYPASETGPAGGACRSSDIRGVEQLLGPQQHLVPHLEHRVDPARVEPRFPLRLCSRQQLAYRRLHRPHVLCVVGSGWGLGRRCVVARRRQRQARCAPRSMKKGVSEPPSVGAASLTVNTALGRWPSQSSLRPLAKACSVSLMTPLASSTLVLVFL